MPKPNEKVCKACKRPKHISQFYRHAETKDGRESKCKTCKREAGEQHRRDRARLARLDYLAAEICAEARLRNN